MRFNYFLFFFKFSVIILTIFSILQSRFHVGNFAGMLSIPATGSGWHAIFSAVATGGIVLAFNGFKSGVELAGETKKLSIAIPISTAGSVAACILLYLGLQICFIGALDPSILKQGWQHLNFTGDTGPFVGLAAALGLLLLLKLLYLNSIASPLSAGLMYVTSTARLLYAMSKIGYMPAFLSRLNHQRFPVWAIIANFALGMVMFFPMPGWQAMVNFLVSLTVITYAMGPISLMSLRLSLPNQNRPFKLPLAKAFCLFAFYCCNLFSYWTGWETVSKLAIAVGIGLALFSIAYLRGSVKLKSDDLKALCWILPYFSGLILISYLGAFGGKNIIPFGWDFVLIGVFSYIIFTLSIKYRAQVAHDVTESIPLETLALKPIS